jgi:hypothetical protein
MRRLRRHHPRARLAGPSPQSLRRFERWTRLAEAIHLTGFAAFAALTARQPATGSLGPAGLTIAVTLNLTPRAVAGGPPALQPPPRLPSRPRRGEQRSATTARRTCPTLISLPGPADSCSERAIAAERTSATASDVLVGPAGGKRHDPCDRSDRHRRQRGGPPASRRGPTAPGPGPQPGSRPASGLPTRST